jgi:branched-chain amino acid transport system ATP-binding protein
MLTVTNLQVAYGQIQVVWDVSFTVPRGAIVALIGPNGAGKSTTLKAILGLLPLKAGQVTFEGQSIVGKPTHDIVKSGLVLVPESRATFASLTVMENLELGAFSRRARPSRDRTLAEVFQIFPRLKERQTQLVGTLSGGERQMVAIGKALMARPDLLILDEPSLGLAPLVVERIFDVVEQINQHGVSILLVEQNVQLSLETAHYGFVIEQGRIVNEGTSADLLGDSRVQDAYLSF